jgi:hypothetical protein
VGLVVQVASLLALGRGQGWEDGLYAIKAWRFSHTFQISQCRCSSGSFGVWLAKSYAAVIFFVIESEGDTEDNRMLGIAAVFVKVIRLFERSGDALYSPINAHTTCVLQPGHTLLTPRPYSFFFLPLTVQH